MKYIFKVLILAAAYYLSGRLGLALTIPPGQATAIWPASGIALAGVLVFGARYWPAVFLGAVGTSLYHPEIIDLKAMIIACSIASGASVQALLGCYLIRLRIKSPFLLDKVKDIAHLLFFGGLISCIVNATVGTLTIYKAGFLPVSSIPMHWFTWWAGDVIGIIVFTPVLLLLFSAKSEVSLRRKVIVGISLLLSFMLIVYFFVLAKNYTTKERRFTFNKTANEIAQEFQDNIDTYLNLLVANERFVVLGDNITVEQFNKFNEKFLTKYPGIYSIGWTPVVTFEKRAEYEASVVAQGFPGFVIKDRVSLGSLNVSPQRPLYTPVTYIYPYEKNKAAHGYDVYGPDELTNNARRKALDKSRDLGLPIGTGRISIVQAEDAYGLIVYHPVYSQTVEMSKIESRKKSLIGYIGGVFILPNMLKFANQRARENNMFVVLKDVGAVVEKQLLYDSRTADFKESDESTKIPDMAFVHKKEFEFARMQWEMQFIENSLANSNVQSWALWIVLVGGLLYVGLIGAFLLNVTARTDVVQRLVDDKTEKLIQQERKLQRIVEKLIASNEELENFAYIASHDLQEPVRIVASYMNLLEKKYKEDLDEEGREYIKKAYYSSLRMRTLIADLLKYSKVGMEKKPVEDTDLNVILNKVLEDLELIIKENNAQVKVLSKLPIAKVDAMQISQLFLNLISNAIKYRKKDVDPVVEIDCEEQESFFKLTFLDNGIGINRQHFDRIFVIFQRMHAKDEYEGTGIGLAVCKRIVDRHQGKISVESVEGVGSKFTILISKNVVDER